MDSLITAAARALAAGDLLGVLKRVGVRNDAAALALRGIAMAQLGDFARARELLQSAARAFGPREAVARARCVVAEAEIAIVSRDLNGSPQTLEVARKTLETHGDVLNAGHARHLQVRLMLLIGRLDEAERTFAEIEPAPFPPSSLAAYELVGAGIAIRRLKTGVARAAIARAAHAADQSRIPALIAEVEAAARVLEMPAARAITRDEQSTITLAEVETILRSGDFVVDGCRHVVRSEHKVVSLATRPVLFALLRALATAWPADVSRDTLVRQAFRAKQADESHRARLRVEIGRLRAELRKLADIDATKHGFALHPRSGDVIVLAPPLDDQHAAVLAFLADGEAWSSSALSLALGTSARTVQRALEQLATAGKVEPHGRGRARRWMSAGLPGYTTTLLLPGPLPGV